METLISKIESWAHDRNLIEGSTPVAQFVKLAEEVGELASGIAKKNHDKFVDSVGDVVVVLTILAAQQGVSLKECVQRAYDEIKDRRGRMVDGVFVKEEDLEPA